MKSIVIGSRDKTIPRSSEVVKVFFVNYTIQKMNSELLAKAESASQSGIPILDKYVLGLSA